MKTLARIHQVLFIELYDDCQLFAVCLGQLRLVAGKRLCFLFLNSFIDCSEENCIIEALISN